jgi:hypothetical protein
VGNKISTAEVRYSVIRILYVKESLPLRLIMNRTIKAYGTGVVQLYEILTQLKVKNMFYVPAILTRVIFVCDSKSFWTIWTYF